MIFYVSVFKRGKSGPELVRIGDVAADGFVVNEWLEGTSYDFYNVEEKWLRKPVVTLVAHYPVGEWVVERA